VYASRRRSIARWVSRAVSRFDSGARAVSRLMIESRSETRYQVAASVKKTATTASPALWPYVATGWRSSFPLGSWRRFC
jgi:hypothetical protein